MRKSGAVGRDFDPLAFCRERQIRLARREIERLRRRIADAEAGKLAYSSERERRKAAAVMRRHLRLLETFLERGW